MKSEENKLIEEFEKEFVHIHIRIGDFIRHAYQKGREDALKETENGLSDLLMELNFDGGVDIGENEHWHYYFADTVEKWLSKSMRVLRQRLASLKENKE